MKREHEKARTAPLSYLGHGSLGGSGCCRNHLLAMELGGFLLAINLVSSCGIAFSIGHLFVEELGAVDGLATEVNPFAKLVHLNSTYEEKSADKDDTPLPADAGVQEDDVVEAGDIENGEDAKEAADDAEEEELVLAVGVLEPLAVPSSVVVHVEEAATGVNHFPGEEQGEPG